MPKSVRAALRSQGEALCNLTSGARHRAGRADAAEPRPGGAVGGRVRAGAGAAATHAAGGAHALPGPAAAAAGARAAAARAARGRAACGARAGTVAAAVGAARRSPGPAWLAACCWGGHAETPVGVAARVVMCMCACLSAGRVWSNKSCCSHAPCTAAAANQPRSCAPADAWAQRRGLAAEPGCEPAAVAALR